MSDEKDVDKLRSSYARTGADDLFNAKQRGEVHNISSSVEWILQRYRNLNNMPMAYRNIIDRKLGLLYALVFVDGIEIDDDRKTIKVQEKNKSKVLELVDPPKAWKQLSKVLRLASGMSQDDVAKILGVTRQTFNQYENDGYIGQRFELDQLANLEMEISDGLLENNFDPQYGRLVFAIFPKKKPTENVTPKKYREYVLSQRPEADFVDKDGNSWEFKKYNTAKNKSNVNWEVIEGTEGTMEQWHFLVDTMSKVYGSMQNQTKADQKKTTEKIATASAKAIPDKFKDDIDSMSATALSGQYKRVVSDLQDKINSIQDDLLQISTLEHVYLKKQLGEHLHEKLFNKPNKAEKSVIEDALKEYKFRVDTYMDQRWNRIQAVEDLGSVLESMDSSFLHGSKKEVKNARK